MNQPHMGWQCPCCRTVHAPSVVKCLECSGAPVSPISPYITPVPHPFTVPTVIWPDETSDGTGPWLPPYEITCKNVTVVATSRGKWVIGGDEVQLVPTEWRAH